MCAPPDITLAFPRSPAKRGILPADPTSDLSNMQDIFEDFRILRDAGQEPSMRDSTASHGAGGHPNKCVYRLFSF